MQHEKNIKDILNEPIAIVGMNCQFPGVNTDIEDVNAFYEMLINKQTSIKEVPENRWDINKYYDAARQKEDKIVSRKGGFLNDPRLFDAPFFKITPTEVKQIDPQQRLFLEVSIRALNHANIRLDSLKDSNTGVYCGISTHDYSQLNYKDHIKFNAYTYIGSADSAAAGRLCYFLNLKGPCITVDTACSSSLSALYLATTALRNRQCDMAIVGGVHLSLCPEIFIGVTKANMLSAVGQCSSFDASADGYARSEGCGVVIVKRLSDAIKDNNTIHGVIKSIVMNQDGGGMGMAAPNLEAQIAMHQAVLEQANLSASEIDYIEAHGTGTVVGDSVEFNAIQYIHQGHHSKEKPLIIGALKSNLGHTISSSGIASLIKVIEALKNETIPANLHFSTPNPAITPESIPALFPVKTISFAEHPNKKRYAQVSNFGFTGTNVSAVIEEAPKGVLKAATADSSEPLCFILSANSEHSLQQMMVSYLRYLQQSSVNLRDVCYTLINCRDHYRFRCAIVAKDKEDLIKKIESQDYELKKVTIKKDLKTTENDAKHIYEDYLSGANIRLDKSKGQYNEVDLPLYSFDRKAYWHDKETRSDVSVPKDWCFQLEWQYQPFDKQNRKLKGNHWLLIGAKQLASGFIEQGLHIVRDDDNYSLDTLDGIIFAAGFDLTSPQDIDASIDLQKKTLKQLLTLIKVLNHKAIELQLIVLTHNAIAELAVNRVNLGNSMLPGFCKTLVLELPQYKSILIDLDKTDEANYAKQVVNEMNHNHGSHYEHVVAYRDGKRLVSRLKKATLYGEERALHGDGRYLISGGCGGLGLVTAQALLLSGAKELILVSRNVDKPSLKASIKKIQSHYPDRVIRTVSLDITDKEKLRHLLAESNVDGLLKGIVHAAGASLNAPLLEHQDEDIDHLFSAKVQGGWYLHELTRHCNLDFFVVYSSVSSVFGSNKESVYSATNSFLDALIAERHRLGLAGTAIQWGPWAEVGMAEKRAHEGLKQALIHNEQGCALINQLIHSQLTYATIISPEYLKFMLDFVPKPLPAFYQNLANDLTLVEHKIDESISPWLNEYFKIDHEKRFITCKNMLSAICKQILGLPETEDLDDDGGFFEIGFDSLMITEMATRLKETLKPVLNVAVTAGFEYPSINKLAKYIESELENNVNKMQALQPSSESMDDSIAIIGMSCSLPNAPNIVAFETLLENGLSGIREIPIERWDNKKYYDPNPDAPGKSYVNKLGLIENIKCFDAHFFGISPREAPLMDPQQRLFLENCYLALENANYPPLSLRGSLTGVFAGVGTSHEYYSQLEKAGLSNDELGMFAVTGKALNIIPGRVAYTFDFKGPALSIDTACSSSLVAIHYACQSLKNREIDLALAGGVNVLLRPESIVNLCKAKALSPESQCKTFDENADGYARSEGCGVLLLKRTTDALRDKDNIFALIKASAITNDGKSAGLTVPNGKSQEEVMMMALEQTELSSTDISYVEAHGTGTPLGDPIEVHAINKVYGAQRGKDNPLYIGAVKTNIGHLESAAGVASVIKTIISLQKGTIYKNLNFNKLNPHIKINDTRIAVHNTAWSSEAKLKCAGVNAFGFSGTNAHLILQEFPANKMQRENLPAKANVLILSAKSQAALDNLVKRYQQYLETTSDDFNDVCFTAATCRDHYTYRVAVAAENVVEASQLLHKGEFASSHGKNNLLDLPQDKELQLLVTDYLQGKKVDWVSYYKTNRPRLIKVALPNYSFDRAEFWLEKKRENGPIRNIMHPLLGQMLSMPGDEYLFSHQLDVDGLSYINQYRVFEKVIFPAAAYIESGLATAKSLLKCNTFCIEQFNIERPLYPVQGQDFQLQAKPGNNEQYKIELFAKQNEQWQKFSEMEIHELASSVPESVAINDLKLSFDKPVDISQFYAGLKKSPLFYGDVLQVLQEGYVKSGSVLTKVALAKTNEEQGYYYHPLVLESAIQSIFLINKNYEANTTYLPYAFTRMTTFQDAPRTVWIHVTKRDVEHENELSVDILFYDNSGLLIGSIDELRLRKVQQNHFISYESVLHHLYEIEWEPLNSNILNSAEIADLWVIAKNEIKAKKVMGTLRYQLVDNVNKLENVENKNIVFLYEQEQFNDLFHYCQSMFKLLPASFILVTENAYAINNNSIDKVNPYHTMASSFWKSFRNELEFNKNYTIDLDSNSTLKDALRYLFNTTSTETQFAARDLLYVPRLKRKQIPIDPEQPKVLFDREASYLITGGTGGLAEPLIDYLIRSGVKHIIITSRSECPTKTKDLIDSARKKQVCVRHYSADASNLLQMKQIIEEIEQSSRPLRGVFHLAGVIRDELIVNLDEDAFQQVLNAKMDSALVLHQLTKNLQLDLFVLFSSSASILGSRGQSNYVAANGFLDGLAHLRQQQGLPAIAINWGAFNTLGMTAKNMDSLQRRGFIPLAKEHIDVLDVLLQSQLPQIVLCPIHWDIYFKNRPKYIELSDQVKHATATEPLFLSFLQQHSHKERVVILSQTLCDITADILGLTSAEQVGVKNDLFSLGMDSLMSLDLRNRIHDKLRCPTLSLPIEYFINEPRIEKIARNIANELHIVFEKAREVHGAENATEEEIPLSDTQYVFWVIRKLGSSFNCGMQLQLHGKLNKEYLSQAMDFAIKQNSVFWININDDVPVQRLKKQGQFNLIYEDISSSYNPQVLNKVFFENIKQLIPFNEQPLIRIYLYKLNHDLHELHIMIPHIILDDSSYRTLFEQFKKNYETLLLGNSLVPVPENYTYFDYVKQNNFYYEQDLQDKVDFWRVYNKGFQRLSFGRTHHLPDATNQAKNLFHYPLDARLIEKFKEWHQEKNINVSTGLIAACQIVFYKLSRQKKIPITILHSGREGSHYKSVIGLFTEYKRLNITLNKKYKFIDFLKSIEEQLLKTAPYQKCSQAIKIAGLRDTRLSIGQYLTYVYSKLFLMKHFKKTGLNPIVIDYHLRTLSLTIWRRINYRIKYRLNQLFKLKLRLQKPARLRILINITASFFIKDPRDMNFAGLNTSIPYHYGSVDRPISNQALWLYFTKDQYNEYRLSINGPLTIYCKDQIAQGLNQVMMMLLENDELSIDDLLS
ncbi:SDR family NAD(P)-dependent oxidoreductase [Legionella maioricensis]|uniref:SDR family NAD(P)-dependent oxidoreductase n=1 Tax=Legionella maioricensis TaxID=2896528 RepID=A0A9X2D0B6_9GAMM|nr:SDR family NAD(P)-dependent oxidoreductase [Legionella maioricensis]MCL9683883.1 SDR family NAD(P)-dependent oxidoreductase [Legionella maioricensis]